MEPSPALETVLFYLWWLLVNGFTYCAEYDFLSRFVPARVRRGREATLYVGVNCVLTFFALLFQLPSLPRELLHTAFLCGFSFVALRLNWAETIVPAAVIFTLSNFMEGISVAVMRLLVVRIPDPVVGNALQMILTAGLALLFFFTLRKIAKRYQSIGGQGISLYLYTLLLPCAFVVWVIRFGFGLDNSILSPSQAPFASSPPLWAFLCIFGAAATFFVVLEVFSKILILSRKDTEKALLDAALREQRGYLAEAEKRNSQFRAFQHDIDNHLSVLAGLFQEKKYVEAEQYLNQLHVTAGALRYRVSTGNSALDVLLGEKISYAEQNGIAVSCEAQLASGLLIDDIDLCIIFSNALDNAIRACLQEECEERNIKIAARTRHQLLLVELTNSCRSTSPITPGTGMKNMRHIAEKYQGTMDFEKNSGVFRLSVLLCGNPGSPPPSA